MGMAWRGKARQGRRGKVWFGLTRRGEARFGRRVQARHGLARHGRPGAAGFGAARLGWQG